MTCRCRSGECDPECDGPKLRAEIERLTELFALKWDATQSAETEAARAEIERLTGLLENSGMTVRELLANDGDLRAEIERLTDAIRRIDGINDNPADYNPAINAVCDEILRPHLAAEEPKP